ncbi:mitochondrial glutathione transporter SLC25A40-like isoform X2 [Oratosquilla oratoria]|uniref:mitochondrial glutathione transporter SLC25A40-like isoform X2 n=1 Tax=Oratosquilla oratoria TaxID=337810 RepID=UPI003F7619A6
MSRHISADDGRFMITPPQQMMSSCAGALLTSVFMTPFDVVKVRLQTQQRAIMNSRCFLYSTGIMDHICKCTTEICTDTSHGPWYNRPVPKHFTGTFDAFVKISKLEGPRTLWSGLPPTLIVSLPNTVIYFTSYEQLRQRMQKQYLQRGEHPPMWLGGLAGALARIWAVTLVSPFELIRTKMQSTSVTYRELAQVLHLQLQQGGVTSLWRGWVPTILRDVPFSAIYWLFYENLKRGFNQEEPVFAFSMCAGAVSGGLAASLTLPFDVVKTHMQIEIDKVTTNRGSTVMMLQRIYNRQGVTGLFAGLVPRLAKVMPACAIMISSYEYAKTFFRRYNELHSLQEK